jgi:outer membrane protein
MKLFIVLLFGFLCLCTVALCNAEELPLWEAGLGFTGLSIPDYRGSDERHGYFWPIPYLIYRGDILRVDRKGMYGLFYHSQRLELNISLDGGVPVKSDRNSARIGMPDLDPTIQIGPSIEVCLVKDCDADRAVQLRIPVPVGAGILALRSDRSSPRNNTTIIFTRSPRSTPSPTSVHPTMPNQDTAVRS